MIVGSCKREYSCEGCDSNNKPPIAVAGSDQVITLPTDSVLLNGNPSSDPDGKVTVWRWTKIDGPSSYIISHIDSAITIVKMLVQGSYHFELKVTDNKGASATDTIIISVKALANTNQPPFACAGEDQTITLPVNSILLDGSCSTDPDNNITSYLWTKISGPSSFNVTNANVVQTQVTNLSEGTYLLQLKVTDAGGLVSMDTVQAIVKQNNNPAVDIYVTGQEQGVAKYWKNGKEVALSSQSTTAVATSIAIVDNDVYVAGGEGDFFTSGDDKAKYWKNGQEVFLTTGSDAGATSIAVDGGDVHVTGWETIGTSTFAKYWKNGKAFSLTDGSKYAEATCIVVNDGDVYISGFDGGVAKYWKNGQAISLTDGSNDADAYSIAVVGGDVYVAGSEGNGSIREAKYWKNGVAVTLSGGSAQSIAVAGSDVYVTGYDGSYYNTVAKYWKNNQEVFLTNTTNMAYALSIAVFGGDVYVAGYDNGRTGFVAKYWKNGQEVSLTNGSNAAWATEILVVPR